MFVFTTPTFLHFISRISKKKMIVNDRLSDCQEYSLLTVVFVFVLIEQQKAKVLSICQCGSQCSNFSAPISE